MSERPATAPWIRATALGWLLGVPLVALFALAAEGAGVGGAQVFVGLGVGAGVGVAEGAAEARQVLAQLTPGSLSQLVGRALVIYPAGNPGGSPLACGVIGFSSQTATAINQNSGPGGAPGGGSEGLAP